MTDIATALTGSVAANGETPITANIPFNNFKITGLAPGTVATDSVNLGQVQAEYYSWCGTAGGTANALTLSALPAITAYAAGQVFRFKSGAAPNSGATTVAISALSTIAVQNNGIACIGGEIAANSWYEILLDTTSTCQLFAVVPFLATSSTKAANLSGTPALPNLTTGTTQALGDNSANLATTNYAALAVGSNINGLGMSTAGSSTTMSIASGFALDSTRVAILNIAAFTKSTASWTVGSAGGALDTGATGGTASTWYYWYLIGKHYQTITAGSFVGTHVYRILTIGTTDFTLIGAAYNTVGLVFTATDVGAGSGTASDLGSENVDLIFSLSSSLPTLPATYTQYRYIGAGKLDGGKNWTAFTQMGREFYWSTPILEGGATYSGSATAALITCTVPLGRKVKGFFALGLAPNNISSGIYISDPANADLAVSASVSPLSSFGYGQDVAFGSNGAGQASCWTDTSGRIRHRENNTATGYGIVTLGWTDLADTNL
jgi:hypothetical protein